LLETNPVPILWTSNNIHEIDPALLRRMTVAVELKMPPARQRERILKRLAERHGVALSASEIEELSQRVHAAPAVLENALRAAALAGGGAESFERAAQGIVRAVSGSRAQTWQAPSEFDPRLIRASRDLTTLTNQLEKRGDKAFSLCLSGPPGTGKSAYARYLAGLLGLEVVQKRASDLLGMYVGESEKRIAEAFEEARDSGSFLIFDEADSFLLDRKDAVRSWEITQVNEMLTWMEQHPFPVCFTTNLMDRLDAASLRRFTFHIRFDFLNAKTLRLAYDLFFAMTDLPTGALRFDNLTPGDFAQAAKQADVLGFREKPDEVIALLTEISRGKPGAFGRIGFQ
jgi:SpoVK/Ycf46/Vps4 family AAA+-type ATPase